MDNNLSEKVLSGEEFASMVEFASKDFFKMHNYLMSYPNDSFTRKYYSTILYVSDTLETFLDKHGARRNRDWVLFTEIIASIRNMAIAGFHLIHLLSRYRFYKLDDIAEDEEEFHKEGHETMVFFNGAIFALFKSANEEVAKYGIKISEDSYIPDDFHDIFLNKQLARNADDEHVDNNEERIIEISRRYRKAAKIARELNMDRRYDPEELIDIIPVRISENKMQKLKNLIQGVQSDYDTYVRSTKIEMGNEDFLLFRGHISIPVHLMTVLIMLTHFYERHENEIRHGETKEKIAKLVDKNRVLDRAVNFAFFYCNKYLQNGNILAETLLSYYVVNVEYELPIPEPLGFHARPATYVSLIVNEHGTDVFLVVDKENRFNAKSVLNLMEAGGLISERGMSKVTFVGDKRALDDLKILAENNYCEDGNIPMELNYLRILRNVH